MTTYWGIEAIHASPLCWLLTLTLSQGPNNVLMWPTAGLEPELTIGILKSRFQCLRKLRVTPERACDIIVACIATIRGEQHPAVQMNDPEDDHPIHPADVQDGRAVRDLICRNFFWWKQSNKGKVTCDLVLLYSLKVQKQQVLNIVPTINIFHIFTCFTMTMHPPQLAFQ